MNQPALIRFNSNGTTVAFDKDGNQINELNFPWFRTFLNYAKSYNIDLTIPKFVLPGGILTASVEKTLTGYDWIVKSRWDNEKSN